MAAAIIRPPVVPSAGSFVLQHIGNTPLLRLQSLSTQNVTVCAKAEFYNPGGSVKDRPALSMIEDGERSGKLDSSKVIIDATSGNTGIAYAMIGAAKGYRVKLCLPLNASMERKRILKAYGAEVIFTDPAEGSDGAIRKCRELYAADPDAYFYPDQYNNPANWQAHYHTTAAEILEQTGRRITHFIAGLGTSGTCMGVTRRLKQELRDVHCYSVQPASGFHGLEGLKHMPTSIQPGIYDPGTVDGNLWLETEDAHRMVRKVARDEGVLVGVSSGANLRAATTMAGELEARGEAGLIVTVLCDGADKYLSEHFWDDHN